MHKEYLLRSDGWFLSPFREVVSREIFFFFLFCLFLFFCAFFTAVNRILLAQARTFVFGEVKIVTRLSLFDAR